MKKTISIQNKKASATLIVEDFIESLLGKDILFMTAYGPTQELRCFAQILGSKDGTLEINEGDTNVRRINNSQCLQTMAILQKPEHGYSALVITPTDCSTIIGTTEEECFAVFGRILDQSEFVHRDWYRFVWDQVVKKVDPAVGKRLCYQFRKAEITSSIQGGLQYGGITMPPATADLTLAVHEKQRSGGA